MIIILIILLVILVLALIFLPFIKEIIKDKLELAKTPIDEKFKVVVEIINDKMFDGKGELTLFDDDPRSMNLFCEDMKNYLIQFYYSTGTLSITLNYKYYKKELVHKEEFHNLRKPSESALKETAYSFIAVSMKKILEFQNNIGVSGAGSNQGFPDDMPGAAPTSILSSYYEGLSESQKKSFINLLYYIAQSGGKSDDTIIHTKIMSNQLQILHVDFASCKKQFEVGGEEKIITDLKNVDKNVIVSTIVPCLQIINALYGGNPSPVTTDLFLEVYNKLGFSEKNIEEVFMMMNSFYEKYGQ